MSLEELRAHLSREGFGVPEERLAELHAALPLIDAMRRRVHRPYEYADEPAVLFVAGEGRP
jgi:hypothetical protein